MSENLEKLRGDHSLSFKELYSRSLRYVKKEWVSFLFALILIGLNVAIDIVLPLIFGYIIDIIQNPASKTLSMIALSAGGMLLLSIISQVFLYTESMMLQKAGQRIVFQLRMEVFSHIESMSINQFDEMPVGSLVTRVANYTTAMSDLFTDTIVRVIKDILTVIGVFIEMMIISIPLALIILAFFSFILVVSIIFRKYISQAFKVERGHISDLNSFLSENISGMKITQIFNQQQRKKDEFNTKNKRLRNDRLHVIRLFTFYRPIIMLCQSIAIGASFIFGIKWALTAGSIVSFYLLISKFFEPIQNLADALNSIQKAQTAAERLFNLLDVKPDLLDDKDAKYISHFEGKIEFKNVWFAYEKDNWILKDVSFTINPHETCAFVGATGSGKTTILSLLVRNYEIQKGQILIDNIDIKTIKVESLRKAFGQMLQDVFLFSGTIKTNITLHDNSINEDEILAACEYVNADKFINKLPDGLNSQVIERGENYSQGQRQLLSFARTVLHKPQMLILDEATANIDTETEVLIQESLEKMKNIGTMLIVAHRLSTIQKADQIICLMGGQVVEHGNHQQLLKNKGYYYKLFQLQLNR